ncbi:hypothetical protein BJ684DRAFT_21730 [Piptocephalis cylindrospora]|uniref:SP-RING-type domain-containing protein n=1 Tax=Piptocephalis cylindrospora TaxID=1907219 RepID=A0A4P9XYZ9_9FUNG|nr:hypothetical protein BJ684DRAFT_21730 [Piptocephalis cylindrospora]|eukprot:RKP11688.1 hypothetical protein BJ684DRAFT_21730 [Piptocephalis cylindrospora]
MAQYLEGAGLRRGAFPIDKEELVEYLCPFFGLRYAPRGWGAAPTTHMAQKTTGSMSQAVFLPQERRRIMPPHVLAKIPRLPLYIREEHPVVIINLATTTRNPSELVGNEAKRPSCIRLAIQRAPFVDALRRGIGGIRGDELSKTGDIRALVYLYNQQHNEITSFTGAMRSPHLSVLVDNHLQSPPSNHKPESKEKGLDITSALGIPDLQKRARSPSDPSDLGKVVVQLCMTKGTLITGLAGVWLVRAMNPKEAVANFFRQRLRFLFSQVQAGKGNYPKDRIPSSDDLESFSLQSLSSLYYDLINKGGLSHAQFKPRERHNNQGGRKRKCTEDEVKEGDEVVIFTCPITLRRINYPGRGDECLHPQCFDIESIVPDARFYKCLAKYPSDNRCLILAKGGDAPISIPRHATEITNVESLPETVVLSDNEDGPEEDVVVVEDTMRKRDKKRTQTARPLPLSSPTLLPSPRPLIAAQTHSLPMPIQVDSGSEEEGEINVRMIHTTRFKPCHRKRDLAGNAACITPIEPQPPKDGSSVEDAIIL